MEQPDHEFHAAGDDSVIPSEHPDYARQVAEWERRLSAEGMPAELVSEPSRARGCTWLGKSDYYALAGQFLYEYVSFSPIDRQIWEAHSAGQSVRRIAGELGLGKDAVFYRVRRLRRIMLDRFRQQTASEAAANS